jgi:hypothetical protein
VLDVVDGLLQQDAHMRVVQGVDNASAAPLAGHESEVAKEAQLVRDGRSLHGDGLGQLPHGAGRLAQATEDAHATQGRQRLHRVGDLLGGRRVERRRARSSLHAVAHMLSIDEHVFTRSCSRSASGGLRGGIARVTMPGVSGRPRLAWLLVFALTVAGWISAHEVAYRLAITHPHDGGSELPGRGHAHLAYGSLVIALSLLVAIVCMVGLVARPAGLRAPSRRLLLFVVFLPPLGFALQELAEGLLATGALPYEAASEPAFLLGILLQLPFALAALVVARVLFAFARCLARCVGGTGRPKLVSLELSLSAAVEARPPRLPALAFGYGERGPPRRAPA